MDRDPLADLPADNRREIVGIRQEDARVERRRIGAPAITLRRAAVFRY